MRNFSFKLSLLCIVASLCAVIVKSDQVYLFFEDGEALSEIALPEKPEPEERDAANLLQKTLEKMSGVVLPIVVAPSGEPSVLRIHVGKSSYTEAAVKDLRPGDFDLDGFIIHPVDARNLVLVGERPLASFYAVTELLEEYAGALWVWPSESGTVIPEAGRLEAKVATTVSQPAFFARRMYITDPELRLWRIHKDGRGCREIRSQFHHNIKRNMPYEMWDEHPEYFSEVDGERRKPVRHQSQPCTSNPDVVKLFADAASRQFRQFPWVNSFSTSQGDGGAGFCECSRCRALDVPGEPGLTDRWFTFVNEVAASVADEFPGYRITNLAYSKTVYPPVRIKLRDNVVAYPVISSFPLEERDDLVRRWSEAAQHLGAYFWMHAKPVPKIYPRRLAEYLRFLRGLGYDEFYAEMGLNEKDRLVRRGSWEADGPRVWLIGKLLWNPDADVGELMERFVTRFYGPAAAPMRRYYEVAEAAWERRADPFDFGKAHRAFDLELYTRADIELLLAALEEASAAAGGSSAEQARVRAQREAWVPYLGYYMFDDVADLMDGGELRDEAAATAAVDGIAARAERAERLTAGAPYGFMPPGADAAIDAGFTAISESLGERAEAFWVARLAAHPALKPYIAPQLTVLRGESVNLARNPGFEKTGEDREPPPPEADWKRAAIGWSRWVRANCKAQVTISDEAARSGRQSMRIGGGGTAAGIHNLVVKPGERYRVSVWAMTPFYEDEAPDSKITLGVKWKTRQNRWLPPTLDKLEPLPPETPIGEWRKLTLNVTVPPDAARMLVHLGISDQGENESVFFDDVFLEPLASAP